MRVSRVLVTLATASIAVLLAVACSDSGDPVAPPTVPANVSFKKHIQPIYNSRCAIAGCHVMPNPQAGLDLSPGVAYANTVNVPTQVFTPGVRVTPDDPSQSVLYLLVESGQMPDKGARLTSVQVQTIKKWIVNGALDN